MLFPLQKREFLNELVFEVLISRFMIQQIKILFFPLSYISLFGEFYNLYNTYVIKFIFLIICF
jgi:Zn-dependent peptidase ImmA (M78 family)